MPEGEPGRDEGVSPGEWFDSPSLDPEATKVHQDRCVWCKLHADDWAEDTHATSLGTGETMCSVCLEDVRRFKRTEYLLVAAHESLAETCDMEAYHEAVGDAMAALGLSGERRRALRNAGEVREL